jgi:hypothetical protein
VTDLIAARCVFAFHLAFLGFVVFGGLLVAWRPRVFVWLHLPALAWGVWIVASHGLCPRRPWKTRCSMRPASPATTAASSTTTWCRCCIRRD